MAQGYDTDQAFPPLGARTDTGTLFGPTMRLVAVTAALFTLGAYLARNLPGGWGVGFWLASLGCLLAMNVTVRQSTQLTLGLLFGFGLLVGLATAPTIASVAKVDPEAVWEAGGATALFVAGFGAAGYATPRDLSAVARVLWWALIALVGFGVLGIFVSIPAGAVISALGGLVIFAGLVMIDFQRLRVSTQLDSAPLLAASIFLTLFGRTRR
jgi:FtsH-binding integral membrane protein